MNEKFEPFFTLFDELYQSQFVNYPKHPKFNLWRMMIKTWERQVYRKNEEKILKGFIEILFSIRDKNVKYMLNDKDEKDELSLKQ